MTLSGFFLKNPKFTIKIDLDNVIGMGCIFLLASLWFMREEFLKYPCVKIRISLDFLSANVRMEYCRLSTRPTKKG